MVAASGPATMTGPIRVLLVDDDPLVLSGLKMMLGGAVQVQVVGEARNGHEVLPAADLHHPDVVRRRGRYGYRASSVVVTRPVVMS